MGTAPVERRIVGLVTCPAATAAARSLAESARQAAASRGLDVRVLHDVDGGRLPARLQREVAGWLGVVTASCAGTPRPPATGERRVVLDAAPNESGWLRTRVAHVVPDDDAAARHVGRSLAAQAHAAVAVAATDGEPDLARRWVAGLQPTLGRHGAVSLAWSRDPAAVAHRLERLLVAPAGARPSVVVAMSDETAARVHAVIDAVGFTERVRVLTRTADEARGTRGWDVAVPGRAMADAALDLLAALAAGGEPARAVVQVPFALQALLTRPAASVH